MRSKTKPRGEKEENAQIEHNEKNISKARRTQDNANRPVCLSTHPGSVDDVVQGQLGDQRVELE